MATVDSTPLSLRQSSRLMEKTTLSSVSSHSAVRSGQLNSSTSRSLQRVLVAHSTPDVLSDMVPEQCNKRRPKCISSLSHPKRGKTLKWLEEDIAKAINHVTSDPSTSVRKACVLYGVPRSTLRDRLSGRIIQIPRSSSRFDEFICR